MYLVVINMLGKGMESFTHCKRGSQARTMHRWAVLRSYDDYRGNQVHLPRVLFAQGNVFEGPEYRQLSNIKITQVKLCRL